MDLPALADSALALTTVELAQGDSTTIAGADHDSLLYVAGGSGVLAVDDESAPIAPRSAGLVLAGERAELRATSHLRAVKVTVGAEVDLHAAMGQRELVTSLDEADEQGATGARSFQLLFGPHNGSTRATLFAGFIPPGKAPWHYHLYDEIVWVPDGPGVLHVGETTEELGPGSAFRLRPRQVHIVENASADSTMTIIGVFTPAGSPSAAYLSPEIAAAYRVAG